MIIDFILDRKDGLQYDEKCLKYAYDMAMSCGFLALASAIDSGTNEDIQRELCNYINGNNYNTDLCKYVLSKNWLI